MAMDVGPTGFRCLFEQARARLEGGGIPVRLDFGPRVLITDFEPFEQAWGLPIPPSVRQFYLEVGNGLTFQWQADPDSPSGPFCSLNVPTLAGLGDGVEYLRMLNECLAGHDFRKSRDADAARRHYRRQLGFFPFLRANADLLCIEVEGGQEVVVFHDHEWSFYPAGDSGVRLADSLIQFLRGWSEVAFVEPRKWWWPAVIGAGGVIWSEEHFGFYLGAACAP
jgi:hypothetical protein